MDRSIRRIQPGALKAALHDGGEIALLDPREEGIFNDRHLLLAACTPIGQLEVLIEDMVQRRNVRAVWCDDGEGLAEKAAHRMLALGYTDVSILEGGIAAWEAAGYPVYSGVHVPSKAFAEVVEHEAGTPHLTAEEMQALIDAKADIAIFDTRSYEEFHDNSIPGAMSAPGAELVYRFKDLVPSPDTLVIVNCGGRTRSIIGAQALINAGVPNRVMSLKNGTQAWHLAGYQVAKGATRRAQAISPEAAATAQAYRERFADFAGISAIDAKTLARWHGEGDCRTLYLIDVRTAEEYVAGHVPGARHVAGGQLVQETDRHVAVWGARVVLFDDDGVRATITASWLKQMGWDVVTMRNAAYGAPLATGPYQARVLGLEGVTTRTAKPTELLEWLSAGAATVVDLGISKAYRAGHIPGAWFALRGRLGTDLAVVGPARRLVFTSPDGRLARLAAMEHKGAATEVLALDGGTDAWRAAGLPLEAGETRMASEAVDIRLRAREQRTDIEAAMRAYLSWEINLVNQMAVDEDKRFRLMTPA
jgi:rhodanese-related sulfurtransferase